MLVRPLTAPTARRVLALLCLGVLAAPWLVAADEEAGPPGGSAWSAADEEVIGRIARDGMTRLASFLGSPPAPGGTPPAPADEPAPNVAFVPSQTGILAFAPPDRPQ